MKPYPVQPYQMCIRDRLHGKLVMFKQQVLFGGSVVGVFRVDMLECCQPRHLLSLGPVSYTHLDVYKRQVFGYGYISQRDYLLPG